MKSKKKIIKRKTICKHRLPGEIESAGRHCHRYLHPQLTQPDRKKQFHDQKGKKKIRMNSLIDNTYLNKILNYNKMSKRNQYKKDDPDEIKGERKKK